MTYQPDAASGNHRQKLQHPSDAVTKCWGAILRCAKAERPLNVIYAEAEKLVQYCAATAADPDIEWLKTQVAADEREAAALLAAHPDDPERQRAHAALAGALAGFRYPLGWSPRDLNQMVF